MTFIEWALGHEPAVRLAAFFGMFALMAVWEAVAPRRARLLPRRVRWLHNLALVVLNSLILRLLFPAAAAPSSDSTSTFTSTLPQGDAS